MSRLIAFLIAAVSVQSNPVFAGGWYRPPCESEQRKMEKTLSKLENCLEESQYKNGTSTPEQRASICKGETDTFNRVKETYQKCRTEKAQKKEEPKNEK